MEITRSGRFTALGAMTSDRPELLLTIDLEWYYNGDRSGNIDGFASMSLDERYAYDAGQIPRSVDAILDVLDRRGQRVTFFTVAELDECYADVLKQIRDAGHEIGVHSYRHDTLDSADALRSDLAACRSFQQKFDAVSFRSPRITGGDDAEFHAILGAHGYRIDSSVYGTKTFHAEGVTVIPVASLPARRMSTPRRGNLSALLKQGAFPFGSGMFACMGPRAYHALASTYVRRYDEPPCVYLHSWQICQPKYPSVFLAKHPYMALYSREATDLLDKITAQFTLTPLREYAT